MKLRTPVMIGVMCIFSFSSFAQYETIYFDGADTSTNFTYTIDTSGATNIWQVGPPQKTIFKSAASIPNALVTDAISSYPFNDTSVVTFHIDSSYFQGSLLAFTWSQMLDMEEGKAWGKVEYSQDGGNNWHNALNYNAVYNVYGFLQSNVDTVDGMRAFTGKDSVWREIWLCFWSDWRSVDLRFTFESHRSEIRGDGWMMDNFTAHSTWVHTVSENEQKENIKVYPSMTTGIVRIQGKELQEGHEIKSIELIDMSGRVVQHYGNMPLSSFINIKEKANGLYYLKVNSSVESKAFPIYKIN